MTNPADFPRNRPWLSQGDIFNSAPMIEIQLTLAGELTSRLFTGPAVLFDHGCVLDKATRRGVSTIKRLSFIPLISLDAIPKEQAQVLRAHPESSTPYSSMYVGEVPEVGESLLRVSDLFSIPSEYFGVEIQSFNYDAEEHKHAVITSRDTRVCTLDDVRIALLQLKWIAHWTRLAAAPPPDPP